MWPVLVGCLGVAALSLVVMPTSPTYDPWAWLVWGRDIMELDLNTEGGPSWKPLPVLFSMVFSLFGDDAAPYLWIWVARAGALLGLAACYRVASRLTGGRVTGPLAGLAAAGALLVSYRFIRDAALANSDAMLAGLVLWSFERHLDGRRDHALYLGFAAALLRPEVWPFLGLYGLLLWFREPRLRLRMAGFALLIPILWFGPEYWGSGDAFRASSRANTPLPNSAAFADRPSLELFDRWRPVLMTPVKWGAAVAAVAAAVDYVRRRRQAPVLAVLAGGVAWFGLIALMTEAGYSGNQRYLILATASVAVLGGIGLGRLLQGADWLGRRLTGRRAAGVAAAAVVAVALAVPVVPSAKSKYDGAREIMTILEYEEDLWRDLRTEIRRVGGRERILACGQTFTGPFQTQIVAWELQVHSIQVGIRRTTPPAAILRTRTSPGGPLVPKPTDPRFRQVTRVGEWRLLTVPPRNRPGGGPTCPAASPTAPRAGSLR